MTRALTLLSALLLIASPGAGPDTLRSMAREAVESRGLPGLSIAVTRDGRLLASEAFGFANLETRARATPDSVFQLGSISKTFTAAGVLRLVERGLVSLDAPIAGYLEDAPAAWEGIRVRHLLHHTSGVREFYTLPGFQQHADDLSRQAAELLSLVAAAPLGFRPGDRWAYSNSNYLLLATIIERVTSMPYEELLRREFFDPLGLKSLHHCPSVPTTQRYATGYVRRDGETRPAPPENMNWARGDGGLCGTARDVVTWIRALAKSQALRPASWQRMRASVRTADGILPAYGLGISLVPLDGRVARVAHGGAMVGHSAAVAYYPRQDTAIAVLVNRGGVPADAIEKAMARALFALSGLETRDADLDPAQRSRYAGTYDIGVADFPVRLSPRGTSLWLEMPPPGPTTELRYQGNGLLVSVDEPDAWQVRFVPGDGTSERLQLLMGNMHWYGRRL
jgi:D-alanyl-D-alanine carboxypeptidase